MFDIQKIKNEAFLEAVSELKKENSHDIDFLKKLEELEQNEQRNLQKV